MLGEQQVLARIDAAVVSELGGPLHCRNQQRDAGVVVLALMVPRQCLSKQPTQEAPGLI